jgi:hypothetical protein
MPHSPAFNLLTKIGTTYIRTKVSSNPASGIAAGSENGFGLSDDIDVKYAFTPKFSATLQYESHDMKFAGDHNDRVGATTLNARYRY